MTERPRMRDVPVSLPVVTDPQAAQQATQRVVAQVRDATKEAVDDIAKAPLAGGNEVSFDLASGDNKIPHKLGRKWRRWVVVDIDAAVSIYAPTAQDLPAKFLTLNSSGTAKVKVVVS